MPWWVPLALGGAALIAYLPALGGPFLFDDRALPMLNPTLSDTFRSLLERGVRAATNISLLADRRLWDLNPVPYHVENFVLHCLNAVLVFLIVRRIVEKSGRRGAPLAAGFATTLFLLHPLSTEAVSYIASRSEVLCVFFSYAAYLAFLSQRSLDWGRAVCVMFMLGLAVVSKEPAVAVVPVLALTDYYFHADFSLRALASNWRLYGPLVAGASLAGLRFYEIGSREGSAGASIATTSLDYFLTQTQVIWIYLRLFVLPFGQNIDHAFPMAKAPGGFLSYVGLAALLIVAGAAWLWRRRFPLASLGVFVFLVLLAPTSSFLPIADPLVERRMYLPMIGLLLVVSEWVCRLQAGRGRLLALCAVALLLAVLTMNRNSVYAAPEAMWSDSVRANPSNYRAQFQLAFAYFDAGRCAESVDHFDAASRLRPHDYTMLVDWALALDCAGRAEEALARLRQATKVETSPHAWAVMGMVLGKQNRNDEALDALREALSLDTNNTPARAYRGNVLLNLGRPAEAMADFEVALQFQPDFAPALRGKAAAERALAGK